LGLWTDPPEEKTVVTILSPLESSSNREDGITGEPGSHSLAQMDSVWSSDRTPLKQTALPERL
jgi:hypothetical protein